MVSPPRESRTAGTHCAKINLSTLGILTPKRNAPLKSCKISPRLVSCWDSTEPPLGSLTTYSPNPKLINLINHILKQTDHAVPNCTAFAHNSPFFSLKIWALFCLEKVLTWARQSCGLRGTFLVNGARQNQNPEKGHRWILAWLKVVWMFALGLGFSSLRMGPPRWTAGCSLAAGCSCLILSSLT